MAALTGWQLAGCWLGPGCRLACGLASSSQLARGQLCGDFRVPRAAGKSKFQCTKTFQVSPSNKLLLSVDQRESHGQPDSRSRKVSSVSG